MLIITVTLTRYNIEVLEANVKKKQFHNVPNLDLERKYLQTQQINNTNSKQITKCL